MKTCTRLVSAVLTIALTLSGCTLSGPKAGDTVAFTDSADREVSLPASVTRVAPSGAIAAMMLATISSESIVSSHHSPCQRHHPMQPSRS